jgi:putative DNA primase/helicase
MSKSLLEAMAEAGIMPASPLTPEPNGQIQRFEIASDKRGNLNGWLVCYCNGFDSDVYVFGSWKLGISHTFSASGKTNTDPAIRLQIESARREAERAKAEVQRQAATACYEQWQRATQATKHPYLSAKGIKPHIAKADSDNWLLIPVVDMAGQLTSLQFINPNGGKSFRKGGKINGCFCPLGYGESASTILVCEGFATGATLREASGLPVVVAFNAGNLKAVAMALRLNHQQAKIIVCADNDHTNKTQNVGLAKAEEAAKIAGAFMVYPSFAANDNGTDFNDLAVAHGLGAVTKIIQEVAA